MTASFLVFVIFLISFLPEAAGIVNSLTIIAEVYPLVKLDYPITWIRKPNASPFSLVF
jgi:hypothetical protein